MCNNVRILLFRLREQQWARSELLPVRALKRAWLKCWLSRWANPISARILDLAHKLNLLQSAPIPIITSGTSLAAPRAPPASLCRVTSHLCRPACCVRA